MNPISHGPYRIEATFFIAGRGLVVVVPDRTPLPVGKRLRATVTLPSRERLVFSAWKEWLLRRQPAPHEKDGFVLVEAVRDQIPEGSLIEAEVEGAI